MDVSPRLVFSFSVFPFISVLTQVVSVVLVRGGHHFHLFLKQVGGALFVGGVA